MYNTSSCVCTMSCVHNNYAQKINNCYCLAILYSLCQHACIIAPCTCADTIVRDDRSIDDRIDMSSTCLFTGCNMWKLCLRVLCFLLIYYCRQAKGSYNLDS